MKVKEFGCARALGTQVKVSLPRDYVPPTEKKSQQPEMRFDRKKDIAHRLGEHLVPQPVASAVSLTRSAVGLVYNIIKG